MNPEEKRRKRLVERLAREAKQSLCAVCGQSVTVEDRCVDGDRVLYLHRVCGYATKTHLLPRGPG